MGISCMSNVSPNPACQMSHQNSPEILPPSRLILTAPAGAMCRRRPFALAQKGGRKPINAKCETFRTLPSFQEAYRKRRCILPVDGFFEWKAIKGQKAKQPYAVAMKNAAHSSSAGFGRTGRTLHQASGCAPSRSSQRTPMSWSPRFTTACH
jgi:putative SOS response-associated peptidase YedK